MNRAERRNQKKSEKRQETWGSSVIGRKQVAGQARARTERGLVRHVAQGKGRRS